MTVSNYILFLQKILELNPFTVVDLFFFVCLLIYLASEKQRSFIQSALTLILTTIVVTTSLGVYSFFSEQFQLLFGMSKGLSDGISLILFTAVLGAVAVVGYQLFILNNSSRIDDIKLPVVNIVLGAGTFLLVSSLFFSALISLPLTPIIKNTLSSSAFIGNLTVNFQTLESAQHRLLSRQNTNLINFTTIHPKSENQIQIPSGSKDIGESESIERLHEQINSIRKSKNRQELVLDEDTKIVAQVLSQQMSNNKILARNQISGSTPYDMLFRYRVKYTKAYFIPLHSQNVSIGLNGLMQVPEYKNELISSAYSKIGIGVVELGEHGLVISLILTD